MKNGKTGIGESQMIEACFCEHCLELRRQQERLKEYRKLQLTKLSKNNQVY